MEMAVQIKAPPSFMSSQASGCKVWWIDRQIKGDTSIIKPWRSEHSHVDAVSFVQPEEAASQHSATVEI